MEFGRLLTMLVRFPRHPIIWIKGAREFTSGFGMTYGDPYTAKSVAYDSGREAAHILTLRRYEA